MKFSLVLGGGGAKGLAHIEFLKVLDELNIKPKIIAGTSIGALIGALYASGISAKKIEILAMDFSKKDIFRLTDISFNKKGIIKGKKITNWIEKELGVKTFKELNIPLKIIATDFVTGKPVIIKKGNLITAIRASIAIPGIFEPITYKGKTLVDGGIVEQLPINSVKYYKVAIDVIKKINPPKNPNLYENVMNCFYVMSNKINKENKKKADLYLTPYLPNIGLLDFHKYSEIKKDVKKDVKKFRKKMKKLMD